MPNPQSASGFMEFPMLRERKEVLFKQQTQYILEGILQLLQVPKSSEQSESLT